MLIRTYATANFMIGLGLLTAASYSFYSGASPGDREGAQIAFILACCFLATGAGFTFRNRWLVILASLPVAFYSAVTGFLVFVGGWIWGPDGAATMYFIISACILLILLEIGGIIAVFVAQGRKKSKIGRESKLC